VERKWWTLIASGIAIFMLLRFREVMSTRQHLSRRQRGGEPPADAEYATHAWEDHRATIARIPIAEPIAALFAVALSRRGRWIAGFGKLDERSVSYS
jgi:hypothetical protein